MSDRAKRIIDRADELATERANHENIWRLIAEVLRPLRAEIGGQRSPGDRRHRGIYDSTPLIALSHFKAGIYGMMTNPANRWFDLAIAGDEDLADFGPVKEWLSEVTRRLHVSFGPSVSPFYQQAGVFYADLGAFGTACFYTEERPGRAAIFDTCRSLSEIYIAANQWDEIDTVYRRFRPTARQAVEMFKGNVPAEIAKAAELRPNDKYEFIHACEPNHDMKPGRAGPDGKAWFSTYVSVDYKAIVGEESGYYEMPYQIARWDVAAGETWGRGQGEIALADAKSLQEIRRSNLKAGQRAADPTILAHSETVVKGGVRTHPGAINYGGMSSEGRPLVGPLHEGGDPPFALEMEQAVQNAVKDAFFFSLMQLVADKDMTATEVMQREEQRIRLLAPNLGNAESEFLSPQIKRRFGVLERAGQIPPAPEELSEQVLDIRYVSPLARMQKVAEANGALRVVEAAGMAAEIGIMDALDRVDPDEFMEMIGAAWGSSRMIRSRDEAQAIREQRQQQQQAAMLADGAKPFAGALKDSAQAAETMARISGPKDQGQAA